MTMEALFEQSNESVRDWPGIAISLEKPGAYLVMSI